VAFRDRAEAGDRLAQALAESGSERSVVVALPRGGVPVAAVVARALGAALDVLVVRKLGHPSQPELGIGAIAEGGVSKVNWRLVTQFALTSDVGLRVAAREMTELVRRVATYRSGRSRIPVEGRSVILVDDGLATGFTARVAIEALRLAGAHRVVLAVPVGPRDKLVELGAVADAVVWVEAPRSFGAVGAWYHDFHPVRDEEVTRLLAEAGGPVP